MVEEEEDDEEEVGVLDVGRTVEVAVEGAEVEGEGFGVFDDELDEGEILEEEYDEDDWG